MSVKSVDIEEIKKLIDRMNELQIRMNETDIYHLPFGKYSSIESLGESVDALKEMNVAFYDAKLYRAAIIGKTMLYLKQVVKNWKTADSQ